MHKRCILMHMRTTLNLDGELIEKARAVTGISEKTSLIRAGLEALITRETSRRLAALGGTQPHFEAGRRRRPSRARAASAS
jgi:Arc/MetJ family transcription regulator